MGTVTNISDFVEVYGARVHNLKNIDVKIPHKSLTVITGLSGSGKSSLAFDTIFAEGQRRYIETFSAYARNLLVPIVLRGFLFTVFCSILITGLKPVMLSTSGRSIEPKRFRA